MAKGKLKAGIKKAGAKAKAGVKKAGAKIGKAAGQIGKRALLMPLLPLKVAMFTVLKARKQPVKITDSIDKIAKLFYDAVVMGKNSFDYASYEALNYLGMHYCAPQHLVEEVTSGIIKAILNWFKEKKDKKDRGEALSPEDQMALNEAEKEATNPSVATKKAMAEASGENLGFFARLIKFFTGK